MRLGSVARVGLRGCLVIGVVGSGSVAVDSDGGRRVGVLRLRGAYGGAKSLWGSCVVDCNSAIKVSWCWAHC